MNCEEGNQICSRGLFSGRCGLPDSTLCVSIGVAGFEFVAGYRLTLGSVRVECGGPNDQTFDIGKVRGCYVECIVTRVIINTECCSSPDK